MLDAVITAGGRLSPSDAVAFSSDVKALVRIGGRTILAAVVGALRGTPDIARIVVVGPREAHGTVAGVDRWIDEFPTGEENLMAALEAATTERIVMSASDLPFVTPSSYAGLVRLVGASTDIGYPIFRRDEFLQAYPAGRADFARLADGEWTGGSAFVLHRTPLLRNADALKRGFGARKSLLALATLLGPVLLAKFALRRLRVQDVEARASAVLGANVKAIVGADPAIAMDCDDLGDLRYAKAGEART